MGAADFRVGGRIFATLASVKQGYGNLMLNPEVQALFIAEQPKLFVPVKGGWGANGATHILLADATEDVLAGALRTAWKLRIEKNLSARTRSTDSVKRRDAARNSDPEAIQLAKQRDAELRERLTNADSLKSVKQRYGLDE